MASLVNNHFHILAVDDESSILKLYKKILSSEQKTGSECKSTAPTDFSSTKETPFFEITCCSQGNEAIDAVRQSLQQDRSFSVAFIDLNMPPGPDGVWVAEQIQQLDPRMNIVLVTGFLNDDIEDLPQQSIFQDKLLYLQKPFHRQEIIQFVTALSSKWKAERQLRTLHSGLEILVEKRTAELKSSNELLRLEIESRKKVQQELEQSFGNLKKVMDATIQAIALTVEKRDPYTSGHQQRVACLAKAIATELGLSGEQVEGVYMAAAIHDIGKISLPAEILVKPVPLTDIEISLIQAHAQAGYDILKGISFPWPIADIVLQHHERLDGSGYPQGLDGDKILLAARIICVADVVETMASHRPYRPSIGMDKALEEIAANRGILYDPNVVDACLELLNQKGFELPGEQTVVNH